MDIIYCNIYMVWNEIQNGDGRHLEYRKNAVTFELFERFPPILKAK